jgi:PAS domain S-box-containing protein
MPGQSKPLGYTLAGANPRKRVDASYRTFFESLGGYIASAIADARAYEEERERTQALSELDRAKTVFFSNVSHEFRTPLTLLLGPIESMLECAHPDARVTPDELQLVHRNALRLLKLVNALLDFSRIEAGRIQARYEETDLAKFTAEIASSFRSAMDHAGLDYEIDCPPVTELAYVDRDIWEKIVLNLVSNAFKFTLAGRVAIRLSEQPDTFQLVVEDTGAGIPPTEVPYIFDRFHRVETPQARTHEGSGIGLALVQQLTKLHGGSVAVETEVGRGSRFVLSIPKGKAHLAAEHVRPSLGATSAAGTTAAYVEEAIHWLPESARPGEQKPVFAADLVSAPHAEEAGGRILLADDNPDMRAYVRRLLGRTHVIETVSNGIDALSAALSNPPDLVLTDVMMPGMDGFGLLNALRSHEETRTIPVILLSARAGEDARVEGLEADADDYIVKPFTARELLARVGAHLSLSRIRRETAERERALRGQAAAAQQQAITILESISDGFVALDSDWRFTYVNSPAERLTGLKRDDVIGRVYWDVFPLTQGTEIEREYRRAMAQHIDVHLEHLYVPWQRWFLVRVYPSNDGGISVFFQDITSRKHAEDAIRRANQALRIANADLEQFAHSASHDLREPLRTVSMYCDLLRRRYGGKIGPDADEMIKFCMEGARRMDLLLSDLLSYVRASSDIATDAENVSLETALEEALDSLRASIDETGATVTHDDLPVVRVLPAHAQQLFQNLISNAIKYRSDQPPRIHVGAQSENGAWVFRVEDNGIGMQPEHKDQIFGLFRRLHPSGKYSGTGIGLAICKKIVEGYGGRIWVDSAPGRGSTFFFTLGNNDSGLDSPIAATASSHFGV